MSNGPADDFSRPVVVLNGSLPIDVRTPPEDVTEDSTSPIYFVDAAGERVDPVSDDLSENTYQLRLPVGVYQNGQVVAEQNQVRLARYFGLIGDEFDTQVTDGADVDFESTAIAMIIDTYLSAYDKTLQVISGENIDSAIERIKASFETDSPARRVRDRVAELYALARADRVLPIFNAPDFGTVAGNDPNNPDLTVQLPVSNESTINPVWLDRFGPSGIDVATTTTAFDADLGLAAFMSQLEGCPDPDQIQVVFEVNFNEGSLDQNCSSIVRDKWLRGVGDAGKRMFFVGGVHEESIQPEDTTVRAELNAVLGNRGSWTPNTVPMFDDGTNGDAAAGDNIWTVSFTMPRGVRVGYKYTWGLQGASWTGTEEWPGNQRVLEVTDVNGDNFVLRRDAFGDETTNKDNTNAFTRGNGQVSWTTDANEDGFLDARELPLDVDNNCTLDAFVTPSAVAPATVECEGM
ncbi:MAG: choice-of-anchor X domain-containing protein [Myxococcota bacterium]